MKRIKTILCILLALAMISALYACGGGGSSTNSGGSTSTSSGGSTSTDSGNASTGGSASTDEWVSITMGGTALGRFLAGLTPSETYFGCDAVFDTVFTFDPVTKQVRSTILKNWYWEDDFTFIMEMKDYIYFSNGDNATAEDLLFSYLCHDERGSNYLNQFGLVVDQCMPRDTYTLQMKFEAPFPDFNRGHLFYLIDKSWSLEVGWDSMEWYKPVGSGPYYCEEWLADDHMTLRARDDYWNAEEAGPIYVDEWIYRVYPDASTLFMALEIGDIDLCGGIQASDYTRFMTSGGDGYDITIGPNGALLFFVFSHIDTNIWDNKLLREAIAYGVEWDKVGQLARGDLYLPTYSVASSLSPDYIKTSDSAGTYEYNPEKAKALLAEAGYGPSNPLKIATTTMDNAMLRNAFEAFDFYATQIGIQCDIEFATGNAALSIWLTNEGNDFGFWWATATSPAGDLRATINEIADPNGVSWTSWHQNEKLMEIYSRLANSLDDNVRSQAAKEMQQFMKDDIVYIPVSEYTYAYGFRTDVFSKDQLARNWNTANGFAFPTTIGFASEWK